MKCTSSSLGSHPHLGQTPGLEEASQPNARSPTEDDEHERVACTRKVRLDCVAASSPPKAQGDGTRRALCHSSSVLTFFCGGSMDSSAYASALGGAVSAELCMTTSEWERLLSMDDLKTANLSPLAVKASVMQLIAASSDNCAMSSSVIWFTTTPSLCSCWNFALTVSARTRSTGNSKGLMGLLTALAGRAPRCGMGSATRRICANLQSGRSQWSPYRQGLTPTGLSIGCMKWQSTRWHSTPHLQGMFLPGFLSTATGQTGLAAGFAVGGRGTPSLTGLEAAHFWHLNLFVLFRVPQLSQTQGSTAGADDRRFGGAVVATTAGGGAGVAGLLEAASTGGLDSRPCWYFMRCNCAVSSASCFLCTSSSSCLRFKACSRTRASNSAFSCATSCFCRASSCSFLRTSSISAFNLSLSSVAGVGNDGLVGALPTAGRAGGCTVFRGSVHVLVFLL
mmetsp:Transcript_78766/g.132182  ORF Transcript_78766/g.132182 Transcript_78766/m.132182 type:complete len:451 (+) Transcript_78766:821-2173(+)